MDKTINIGIAGLGTVGCGVIKNLIRNKVILKKKYNFNFNISGISASSRNKKRSINTDQFKWFDDPIDLAKNKDIDLIIELIGGEKGVALKLAIETIKSKKGFITANKALISSNGKILSELASKDRTFVGYEAAVAGGIPIIKTLKSGLFLDEINNIYGILNGTSNFILSMMNNANKSFNEALSEAKKLGYAEADPSYDINGLDAAHKLSILSALSYGEFPSLEDIQIKGIENILTLDHKYANEFGYKIKLVGSSILNKGNIIKEVSPTLVGKNSPLGTVEGVSNVICLNTSHNGTLILEGEGAGEGPTSASVLSDIIDFSNDIKCHFFNKNFSDLVEPSDNNNILLRCYYLRVFLVDEKGSMAKLTSILEKNSISIDQVIQRGDLHLKDEKNSTPVIMLTHPIDSESINSSFSELIKTDLILLDPIFLPVLKDNFEV